MRKILKIVGYVFILGLVLILLLGGILAYQFSYLWRPLKPQEATPFQILLWSTVHDLQEEPEETVDQVLDRIEETVGRSSGKMFDFDMNSVVKNNVKVQLEKYLQNLDNYQLTGSAFFAPENFQELIKNESENANSSQEQKKSVSKPKSKPHSSAGQSVSLPEKNIKFMVKSWYVRTMNRYNAAPESEKPKLMREIVEDLYWWKQCYENLYISCDMRPPTLINMLKELEIMFEDFRESSSDEEYRQILLFREKLKAGFITYETKKQVNQLNHFLGPLFKKSQKQ